MLIHVLAFFCSASMNCELISVTINFKSIIWKYYLQVVKNESRFIDSWLVKTEKWDQSHTVVKISEI